MISNTKNRLLATINKVTPLSDYTPDGIIFSEKYGISSTNMVYILKKLEKDFNFTVNDAFVDAMEMCTFSNFEMLLEKYENTKAGDH